MSLYLNHSDSQNNPYKSEPLMNTTKVGQVFSLLYVGFSHPIICLS